MVKSQTIGYLIRVVPDRSLRPCPFFYGSYGPYLILYGLSLANLFRIARYKADATYPHSPANQTFKLFKIDRL